MTWPVVMEGRELSSLLFGGDTDQNLVRPMMAELAYSAHYSWNKMTTKVRFAKIMEG